MIKDIKVQDTVNQVDYILSLMLSGQGIPLFAEAVAQTRKERGGCSIQDIAKCFKAQFAKEEVESLIKELNHD